MAKDGNTAEFAKILGISVQAVGKFCAQGRAPLVSRTGSGGILTCASAHGHLVACDAGRGQRRANEAAVDDDSQVPAEGQKIGATRRPRRACIPTRLLSLKSNPGSIPARTSKRTLINGYTSSKMTRSCSLGLAACYFFANDAIRGEQRR